MNDKQRGNSSTKCYQSQYITPHIRTVIDKVSLPICQSDVSEVLAESVPKNILSSPISLRTQLMCIRALKAKEHSYLALWSI